MLSKMVKMFFRILFKFEVSILYEQGGVNIRGQSELPGLARSGLCNLTPYVNSLINIVTLIV